MLASLQLTASLPLKIKGWFRWISRAWPSFRGQLLVSVFFSANRSPTDLSIGTVVFDVRTVTGCGGKWSAARVILNFWMCWREMWNPSEQCSVHPGWLFDTGDEILPSYIGIVISQYKDPYKPIRIQWNVIRVLNAAQVFLSKLPSSKRSHGWQWKIPIFNREYIDSIRGPHFPASYGSLPECICKLCIFSWLFLTWDLQQVFSNHHFL